MDLSLNYANFKEETFEKLEGEIIGSNFENCTFLSFDNDATFVKCNLINCKFKQPCKFVKSNVTNELELKYVAENLKKSTFELSNLIEEKKEPEKIVIDGENV